MATIRGGEKFKVALKDIAGRLTNAETVQIGFMSGATYPDGGLPVAAVGAIQEFGAPRAGIPPRPFFRNMIARESGGWPALISGLLKANGLDARRALDMAGQAIQEELQQSIIETNAPPLSEVTLMLRMMRRKNPSLIVTGRTVGEAAARVARGERASGVSTKPLVDSGKLLASPTHLVK